MPSSLNLPRGGLVTKVRARVLLLFFVRIRKQTLSRLESKNRLKMKNEPVLVFTILHMLFMDSLNNRGAVRGEFD